MSISPISPSFSTQQPGGTQGSIRQIRQDFQNLASALKSGDLSGAKSAVSTLQQLMQGFQPPGSSGALQGGGGKPPDKLGMDLAAIGKALQSGDLGSAQDALKKMLDEMQAAAAGHQRNAIGLQGAYNPPAASMGAGGGANDSAAAGTVRINITA